MTTTRQLGSSDPASAERHLDNANLRLSPLEVTSPPGIILTTRRAPSPFGRPGRAGAAEDVTVTRPPCSEPTGSEQQERGRRTPPEDGPESGLLGSGNARTTPRPATPRVEPDEGGVGDAWSRKTGT